MIPYFPEYMDKESLIQMMILFIASGYAADFDEQHGNSELQDWIMGWIHKLEEQEEYPVEMDYSSFIGTLFESAWEPGGAEQ